MVQAVMSQTHKSDRPLNEDERREIGHWVAVGLQNIDVGATEQAADVVQDALRRTIDGMRGWDNDLRAVKLETASLIIGCLWGQTVCDRLGWEWAVVRLGPEWEGFGVVSPNRSHVVFPLQYVRQLLADLNRDQTSLLLYNMLKAGSLPPAEPGAYQVIQ
jgi:hypothetical protein